MSEGYKQPTSPVEKLRALGVTVEEPITYPEFHTPLQLQGLGELGPEAVRSFKQATEVCIEYIEGPVIRDHFGNDHKKRVEWRKTLSDEVYAFCEKNKLRLNVISNVFYYLRDVGKRLNAQNIHTKKSEKVHHLIEEIPLEDIRKYGILSDDQKTEVITKLEVICREFLTLVTKGE
jgi:hypothetical protein